MEVKMLKYANDPCFGKKYNSHENCNECWLKCSCNVSFRNRK